MRLPPTSGIRKSRRVCRAAVSEQDVLNSRQGTEFHKTACNLGGCWQRLHYTRETIMGHERDTLAPTRRGALMLAAGACVTGWRRLDAFTSDFWNKKEPAEWSAQEIEQLTMKSPWSKEASAHFARDESEQSGPMGGGGYPGGGGMGGPRIGGM